MQGIAFWLVNSQFDFPFNLPSNIYCIHIDDITQHYEDIPHHDKFSLMEALQGLTKLCKHLGYLNL